MSFHTPVSPPSTPVDTPLLRTVLSALTHQGAVLALARDMDKGVVTGGGDKIVVDQPLALALIAQHLIATDDPTARILRYRITAAGRLRLRDMEIGPGACEAQALFVPALPRQAQDHADRRIRYGIDESPLALLARRREKDGGPFLSQDLVRVGERLSEDFEIAAMERYPVAWEDYIQRLATPRAGGGGNAHRAQNRVAAAFYALGPGLGDIALLACCKKEGLETAEQTLGWSARSGKIVLRIALVQLTRHYESTSTEDDLIG